MLKNKTKKSDDLLSLVQSTKRNNDKIYLDAFGILHVCWACAKKNNAIMVFFFFFFLNNK